ncbi:hypothetical protein [Streptomyces sp. NPDC096311]|uniref:hypothetical protein n=1 Tax=Streptomyces sp. NPDC096311 TaxID=3366083 RepID=UPI0038037785
MPVGGLPGSIVGGVRGGTIKRAEYSPFASRPVQVLLAVLVLVLVLVGTVQSLLTFTRGDAHTAPLDCAKGTLTLSGSTAFAPVLREAAKKYEKTSWSLPGTRSRSGPARERTAARS